MTVDSDRRGLAGFVEAIMLSQDQARRQRRVETVNFLSYRRAAATAGSKAVKTLPFRSRR